VTRLALFVGNSRYDDPKLAQLKTPAADVRSLAAAFRDPNIGGFDEVVELIDESEAAIRRRLSTFFDRRQSGDLLLCYFSGHGVRDDRGRLYLAARDTSLAQLKATGIPSSYLVEHMDECRSRRQILILDCCNSGAFAHGTKGSDPTVMTRATFEGNGFGRVVLTASDATQYAFEGDQIIEQAELSLFTHYLLEGLSTGAAAPGGDEHITLDQWYDYAYGRVLEQTRTQTPRKWVYNQEGALIIARNPRPRPPGTDLPQSVRDAGRDDRAEVRRGAVTELVRMARTSDGRYRQAAIAALEVLAAKDGNQTVRASAVEALGNLEPDPVVIDSTPAGLAPGSAAPPTPTATPPVGPPSVPPLAAAASPAPSPDTRSGPPRAEPDREPLRWWIGANTAAEGLSTAFYAIIRWLQVDNDVGWLVTPAAGLVGGAVLWRAVRRWPGRPGLTAWLVAMAAAELVVWLIAPILAKVLGNDLPDGVAFVIRGLVFGAVLGAAQWVVLRRWLGRPRPWVGATAVGMAVSQLVFAAIPISTSFDAVVIAMIRGALLGLATAWLVRKHLAGVPPQASQPGFAPSS
jgi:hypothetical protein